MDLSNCPEVFLQVRFLTVESTNSASSGVHSDGGFWVVSRRLIPSRSASCSTAETISIHLPAVLRPMPISCFRSSFHDENPPTRSHNLGLPPFGLRRPNDNSRIARSQIPQMTWSARSVCLERKTVEGYFSTGSDGDFLRGFHKDT